MAELSKIQTNTTWSDAANVINNNNDKINAELTSLKSSTTNFKGYFTDISSLQSAFPNPKDGQSAWVGSPYPGTVYKANSGSWTNTSEVPSVPEVELNDYYDKMQVDSMMKLQDDNLKESIAELEELIGLINVEPISDLTENDGFIDRNGTINDSSSYSYTNALHIQEGYIALIVSKLNFSVAPISKVEEGVYTPLVLNKENSDGGCQFIFADEDMDIVFSYPKYPKVTIYITNNISGLLSSIEVLQNKISASLKNISSSISTLRTELLNLLYTYNKFSIKEIQSYEGGEELSNEENGGWYKYTKTNIDDTPYNDLNVYSYRIKANTNSEVKKIYFKTVKAGQPQEYRNIAIFNKEDKLVFQTFLDGIYEVQLIGGYTAIITASEKAVLNATPTYLHDKYKSTIDKINSNLYFNDEILINEDETKNGYYINTNGDLMGEGTFYGYELALYNVQPNNTFKVKGNTGGKITAIAVYADSTLSNKISSLYVNNNGNINFSIDEMITIPEGAYVLVLCRKIVEISEPFLSAYTIEENVSRFIPVNERLNTLESDVSENKQQITQIDEKLSEIKEVTNWGDSLTAGSGSNDHTFQETVLNSIKEKGYPNLSLSATDKITYSIMMQNLLGDNYKVNNCGVGGEDINTIACRLGANVIFSNEDFVLPQNTDAVQIGTQSTKLKSAWGDAVSPLLQGAGNSVNPCYLEGVECTLKWTGSSYNDPDGIYTIQRVSEGNRRINFTTKTPIILSGSKLYRNTKLSVLWCWTNGGYSSTDELIEKLDKMIHHINTQNYLIIGVHYNVTESRKEEENALANKYGDKFFNWREYVSTNAMYDFGLTPTEDDLSYMSQGKVPPSLYTDGVHLKACTYAILGYKIIERFKDLGYVE
jgi:hypothetical protein